MMGDRGLICTRSLCESGVLWWMRLVCVGMEDMGNGANGGEEEQGRDGSHLKVSAPGFCSAVETVSLLNFTRRRSPCGGW